MKKIIISLAVVVAVAAIVIGGTIAYFSDTETSTGNTFTTGTIDIDIEPGTDWENGFLLTDMKPSQTDYINFRVNNVGSNPVNIWKKLKNFVPSDNNNPNEPECLASSGTWNNSTCSNYVPKYDLQYYINYDLSVEVYANQSANEPIWWQTIYRDVDNKTISQVYGGNSVLLGMIPAGGYMKVEQSYHLVGTVGNWAQNDSLTFDIEIMGEQLTNTVVLDNKVDADGAPGDVYLTQDDGTEATLTYKVKDNKFVYTFDVVGSLPDGNYTLISYVDPWPGSTSLALANVTLSGGSAHIEDSIDFDLNLINAKTWLVPGTYTPGQQTGNLSWNPNQTLFETALMNFYDTDL